MKQNTLIQTAEYVKLAETCYTDFSKVTLKNTENLTEEELNEYNRTITGAMIDPNNGKLPKSFADSIVKEWNIIAHYQDRGTINPLNEESGFSAT